MELARQRISDADLVILVFDLTSNWSVSDQALVDSFPNALIVHNKVDLQYAKDNRPTGLFTSALTGVGIDELIIKIANRLVPIHPPPDAAVPFTLEQIEQVRNFARVLEEIIWMK